VSGETDLAKLLASMSPELSDEEYVFCTFPGARYGDITRTAPFAAICEAEGLTLIIPRSRADEEGLGYESVYKRITLRIHSSLDAVGLTAAFASELTEHGISANVVAGYYHDHIFVRGDHAEKAVEALDELARRQAPARKPGSR
jgi:hypothetical protein